MSVVFVMVQAQYTSVAVQEYPAGDCDCDGNQLDALGVCGGDCAGDADFDGICDDVDDCVDLTGNGCGVGGCTDPNNPGFDPFATFDDGSCLIRWMYD